MRCVESAHVQVLFTVAVEVHGGRAVVAAVAAAHRRPLLEGDLLDQDGLGGGDERGLLLVTVDLLHHRHLSHLEEHNITTMTLIDEWHYLAWQCVVLAADQAGIERCEAFK